jgi:nucleoside-diphosphate-sugar epimerase
MVGEALGPAEPWESDVGHHPPERHYLSVDSALALATLGWRSRLELAETAEWTVTWYRGFDAGEAASSLCSEQIRRYGLLVAERP